MVVRLRSVLLPLHLWIGLTVGWVVSIVSLTGAALIFEPELDGLFNQRLYRATAGDVGHEKALEAARAVATDRRVALVWWPTLERPVYAIGLADKRRGWLTVYVDPGTGRVNGSSVEHHPVTQALDLARTIHVNLLAGKRGNQIVAWSVVAFVSVLMTGTILWWPGAKRLGRGFRIRRHKTSVLFYFDLHRVIGILACPFLMVMALTGLVMAFPKVTDRVVSQAAPPAPESPQQVTGGSSPLAATSRPTTNDFLERAVAAVPDAEIFYVTFPDRDEEEVQVRMQVGHYPHPFGTTIRVHLDRSRGEVTRVDDPRNGGFLQRLLHHWNYPLHVGSIGLWPLRTIYFVVTLAPAILCGTGVFVWTAKRRLRSRPSRVVR